jgi:hypothetical protein
VEYVGALLLDLSLVTVYHLSERRAPIRRSPLTARQQSTIKSESVHWFHRSRCFLMYRRTCAPAYPEVLTLTTFP